MHLLISGILVMACLGLPSGVKALSDPYTYEPSALPSSLPSSLIDPNELTFEMIEKEIRSSKKINSVEDFLKGLSEKKSELLQDFTLMHTSQSLQESSYTNPRVILFGKTGRLIITFNGDPRQKGYQSLEIMQFRSKSLVPGSKSHFEFREINFPKDSEAAIEISPPNPAKCMRCHTQALKPIWDPYEIWEGAYGKRDDAIIDFDNDKYAFRGQENDLVAEHRKELQNFKIYSASSKTHPRYQYLKTKEGSPVGPYSPNIRGPYGFRPNLRLTGLLTRLQLEQIVDQVLDSKNSDWIVRLLLAESLGCDNVDELKQQLQKSRAVLFSRVENEFSDFKNSEWSRFGNDASFKSMSASLFLLRLEPISFSLQKNPTYWQYFEGAWMIEELLAMRLYGELAKLKKVELPSFERKSRYNYISTYHGNYEDEQGQFERFETACRNLIPEAKDLSLEKQTVGGIPSTINMCMSCHEAGVEGPKIDFRDPRKKSEILRRIDPQTAEAQSMPPTRRLGYLERAEIIEYLNSVAFRD